MSWQAYNTACQDSKTCQQQVVNIDNASGISIYNLNTIDLVNSLSVNNSPVIQASKNQNGLSSTVTSLTRN